MTDTKPNPDEVICPNCCHQFRAIPENVQAELAAIKSQPVPVEPEMTRADDFLPTTHVVRRTDYDSLKQQLQVAQQEYSDCQAALKDERYCHGETIASLKRTASEQIQAAHTRAEKAEADHKAAEQNVSDLMAEIAQTGALLMKIELALTAAQNSDEHNFNRWQKAEASNKRLSDALQPFAFFAEQWNKNPINCLHDTLYSIHSGDDAAEFRLSDCKKAAELLREVGK